MQRQSHWNRTDDVGNKAERAGREGEVHRFEHEVGELSDDKATLLYQTHAPPIFAYLRMHTASREDAEDMLVDIFLAVLEHRYFLLLPEQAQRAWLWRVARNKTVDAFRKHRTHRQQLSLDELAGALSLDERHTPEQTMMREEEYAQLRRAISTLSEVQQQILWLRFVSGLRCTEIATVLGRREGTIRSILSRTLNVLRNAYL